MDFRKREATCDQASGCRRNLYPHEEFAPYGYLKATDVTFTVKDTAEVQKVEMKDEVPKGLLIINKNGEFLEKITLLDNVKGTVEHFFEYITGNLSEVTFEVYAAEDNRMEQILHEGYKFLRQPDA